MVLRFFLRNWFQNLARDKIRKQMTDAVQEKMTGLQGGQQYEDRQSQQGNNLAANVGVVFALENESGGMVDLLGPCTTTRGHGFTARRGSRHDRQLVLIESGAGLECARAATEAMIEAYHPSWVISAGFAGGLKPNIKRHDIVVANSVVNAAGTLVDVDLDAARRALPSKVHVGRLLSIDKIARRPSEKQSLGQQFDALAVDLESFTVAEVCRRSGVRFLGVRIVTDAMDELLPPDVQYLTEQKTTAARLGAALGAVCRRPASFKEMMRLKETALVGSDRLGRFLDGLIRELR